MNDDVFQKMRHGLLIRIGQDDLQSLVAKADHMRSVPQFPAAPEHRGVRLKRAVNKSCHWPEVDGTRGPLQMRLEILEHGTSSGVGLTAQVQAKLHIGHDNPRVGFGKTQKRRPRNRKIRWGLHWANGSGVRCALRTIQCLLP